MKKIVFFLFPIVFTNIGLTQSSKILLSNQEKIIIEFNFDNDYQIKDTMIDGRSFNYIQGKEFFFRQPGEPWLPEYVVSLGIPKLGSPVLRIISSEKITYKNKFIIPFPIYDPMFDEQDINDINKEIYSANNFFPSDVVIFSDSYIMRYAKVIQLSVSPFQYNPVTRDLLFNKKIIIEVNYNSAGEFYSIPVNDGATEEYLRNVVINFEQAKNWMTQEIKLPIKSSEYWYKSNKEYYKIYLKETGVYRLTYEYFGISGIVIDEIQINKIELFNEGKELPLYIKDLNLNGLFDEGDYIEFIGNPPSPSAYSSLNIYNKENVYWLSFQADSLGKRFLQLDGNSTVWSNTFLTTPFSEHYEKDSLYERLGRAEDDKRDYWYWGKTSGQNGSLTNLFTASFTAPKNRNLDTSYIKLRVGMHGMTTESCLNPDHRVKFYFTSQYLGETTWDGAEESVFETNVMLNQINIFPLNNLQVAAYGDIPINPCDPNAMRYDEIRINWFEIEYFRNHRADSNYFYFYSLPVNNEFLRFGVFNWQRDNMRIYIPNKYSVISNPKFLNDSYKTVLFTDSVSQRTEYFCVAEDYSKLPDSIVKNKSSDLRNINNGADYLIITHPDFIEAAENLRDFRVENFPDTNISNQRIEIIPTSAIYNEFSYGLMDPQAIREFIKYSFFNWQFPPPSYVALMGDMSYDYRKLIPQSRPNFIPSIPFHSYQYGQVASDNAFVAIVGDDVIPDMAIGRISFETIEESAVLIDKIKNYPDDSGKKWKQNVLLISSGLDDFDEATFGFNDANLFLDSVFLKTIGITSTKIFRYPNKPEHLPFQGEGPEIREGFNDGAIVANYYGHGGGYQWDLVFNDDDIYQLQNESRLPFISSVTCYTAHFDNQDVFGEQFNKVSDKGSIAFFGSSGLTYWYVGKDINQKLFDQIFIKKNNIIGKAIQTAKSLIPNISTYTTQVSLLTLLGEPLIKLAIPDKPDFVIQPSDIIINPKSPVVNNLVNIKIRLHNMGVNFQNDSVTIQLFLNSADTSYYLENIRNPSFGEIDSVIFSWIPDRGGLYNITARINLVDEISEMDQSDNEAAAFCSVFDLETPNIISPIDGFVSDTNVVNFLIADNGYYLGLNLNYFIEIDTNNTFLNPLIKSDVINPNNGVLSWDSPPLRNGDYYWRTKIISMEDSSDWSSAYILKVDSTSDIKGFFVSGQHLLSLTNVNMIYSDSLNSLILNTSLLPPKPSNRTFLEDINLQLPPDIHSLSTFTNDGTYIYFGHIAAFGGPTKIYKLGTGYNNTQKGYIYGTIPNIEVPVWNQIFYYNGSIYVPTGEAYSLLKINPENGDTVRFSVSEGMINYTDSKIRDGAFYLSSDGRYVYNVAILKEDGSRKYTVRIFDPENNWSVIKDLTPTDNSYLVFRGFFAAKGFFFPYENYDGGYMRRINLETGAYEEEWLTFLPYQGYYAWSYDWINDVVYSSVYTDGYSPKFSKFYGTYREAKGSTSTTGIGPASKWNKIEYDLETENSNGYYNAVLEGFNRFIRSWDTLSNNIPPVYVPEFDANIYNLIRISYNFIDSSLSQTEALKLKSLNVDYIVPPEILVIKDNIHFFTDSITQGINNYFDFKIVNLTNSFAKDLKLDLILIQSDSHENDSIINTKTVSIPELSSLTFKDTLKTDKLILNNKIKIMASYPKFELYTFNNIAENSFFVIRDSLQPTFQITFDGKEIIDGDIISSKPTVVITLEDNSPLPLTQNLFSIVHNNIPLKFDNPDLTFVYTPYPNSRAEIIWTPELDDGKHTLEVLAKDSSGNFFDSTSNRSVFYVYNNADILNVYNYPNPFSDNTQFTFELRGTLVPEELRIKIYTIAGRLIREINIPAGQVNIGFNQYYWDGKDEDGDEIANGLYFYKVITKHEGKTRTVTQKLAKVK